jgi:hypothetical protein
MNDRDDKAADDAFAGKAKALFDASVEGLDAETRSRLNRGRQAALAELGPASAARTRWALGTGVAAAAVVTLSLLIMNQSQDLPPLDTAATDIEILLDEDSLEMLEELEFYSWIELAEDTAANPSADDQVG